MAIKKTTKTTKTATAVTNSNGWNTIRGRMNVFVKTFNEGTKDEHIAISTSIGQLNDDGTYTNMYFPVYFKSGVNITIEDGVNILDIKNGFFTVRTNTKTGELKMVIMITECTVVHD